MARETRLGGDGTPVIGIIGKENSKDCTGLGLLMATVEGKEPGPATSPPRVAMPAPRPAVSHPTAPHSAAPPSSSSAREFAPKNGMFTIMMPASVRSTQKTQVLTIHGHHVPIEGRSISWPAAPVSRLRRLESRRWSCARSRPINASAWSVTALVKQLSGKVVEESDTQAESLPGKRYRIEGPGGTARLQLYMLAGWVWYTAVEGKTQEDVTSQEADAFNSSFRLTEKGKSVADKILHHQ